MANKAVYVLRPMLDRMGMLTRHVQIERMDNSADIGLIGLAVMGQNLVLNMNGVYCRVRS